MNRTRTTVAGLVASCLGAVTACLPGATATAQGMPATTPARGVHTDTLWAQSLGIRKALTVYLPPSYATSPGRRYPVLVYLHGLTGNERNWAEQGGLPATMDSLARAGKPEAIVVMPDGDDGWYTTWNLLIDASVCRSDTARKEKAETYCVPWPHYDDYIARDIIAHVDRHYRTRPNRASRGIAGLSMGGFGALTLALAYPDVFGAAASHSGVVSPRFLGPKPFAEPARYATDSAGLRQVNPGLYKWLIAPFGRDTVGWVARDPARLAARLVRRGGRMPALLIDCGVADPYVDQNRDLHANLKRLGIAHEYAEWPGTHEWPYWRKHAAESAAFLLDHIGR